LTWSFDLLQIFWGTERRRMPDVSKVKSLISFKPSFNLKGILEDVIDFYQNASAKMK